MTSTVTLELLSYNRLASSFGLFSGSFNWQLSGEIEFSYSFQALPTAMFGSDSSLWKSSQMGPDLALLILVSIFATLTFYDIVTTWRVERKAALHDPSNDGVRGGGAKRWKSFSNRVSPSQPISPPRPVAEGTESIKDGEKAVGEDRWGQNPRQHVKQKDDKRWHFRSRTTLFWVVYEVVQLALMAGSIATWVVYSRSLYRESDSYRTRFDIYDADLSAPCRFLLPLRVAPSNSTPPGFPGRWELPPTNASNGLTDMAVMLNHSNYLSSLLMIYQLLNGIIIVMFFL